MKDAIYNLIPSNRFITRNELVEKSGLCDREVRRIISELKKEKTIISNCNKKGYKRGAGTDDLKSIEDVKEELSIVRKSINEINSRKKVYNFQLRQYIAYLKILEKAMDKMEELNS